MTLPELKFLSDSYTDNDKYLITVCTYAICRLMNVHLNAFIDWHKVDSLGGFPIEFTPEQNEELLEAGAIGLAYHDRNINVVPSHLNIRDMELASGIIAMERTHTMVWRVSDDFLLCNDLIHYGYNENMLYRWNFAHPQVLAKFGLNPRVVVPELATLWWKKDEIMKDIKSGKAIEGQNEYFTDPTYSGASPSNRIAATTHELEELEHFIQHGTTH